MEKKYIVLIVIIAAAFIGFQLFSNRPDATAVTDSNVQIYENSSSDLHGHDHHDIEEDHADHDHASHEETDIHNDDIEKGHEGHDHESDFYDHDAHEDPDTHEDHSGHGHSRESFVDLMSSAQAEEAGLVIDTLKTGTISRRIKLTGEVRFNQDRLIHLVPRISGVVASVNNQLGDRVTKGDVLAVIHSRELTDIKSEYLSAVERIENAKINFERETALWEKKIIPERQYLESKQNYIETRIALRSAERKLHALGFSEQYISGLADQPHETLFEYRLTAPGNGVIIEKHIVQGELVSTESPVFIIADTSSLWVDLQVYPGDLTSIETGQKVLVSAQDDKLTAEGFISFLSPVISRETRTALARVELSTTNRMWRAGLFATAIVTPAQRSGGHTIVVPRSAVQTIAGRPSVFLVTPEGYIPRAVETGQSNSTHVEIRSGVSAGQAYVSNGTFELKAKMVTSAMDGHAGHGH